MSVLSLFDRTGIMVKPWANNGYECICVDVNPENRYENVNYVEADLNEWIPPLKNYKIVFAFPPCTNLAVSGAKHFRKKGLKGIARGIELVERAYRICEKADAPWMIENPVSVLSSYWRKPDYTFHPFEYDAFTNDDNRYTKKTCLWTGGGFAMPQKNGVKKRKADDRIHKKAPGPNRSEFRSKTPEGFAKAVFEANG